MLWNISGTIYLKQTVVTSPVTLLLSLVDNKICHVTKKSQSTQIPTF